MRQLACGAAAAAWPALLRGAETGAAARGGWARLINPNSDWNFHGPGEEQFIGFLRKQSGLPEVKYGAGVRANRIEELCAYSLLASNYLTTLRDRAQLARLREYAFRGGFIFVDHCTGVEPRRDAFEHAHLAAFPELIPGCRVIRLGPRHPLFSAYFRIDLNALPHGMYGVFDDNRMVGLLSMVDLFCGWSDRPWWVPLSSKMLTNIYAYAINQ